MHVGTKCETHNKFFRTDKEFLNEYPEIANYYFNIKWKSWS